MLLCGSANSFPSQAFTPSMSDSDQVFIQTCMCGHMFTGLNAFTQHEKSCVKGKKCLSGALSRAKEAYQSKKAHIQGPVDPDPDQPAELGQPALHHSPNLATIEFQAESTDKCQAETESDGVRCHTPNRFGTVNMEDNINIKQS